MCGLGAVLGVFRFDPPDPTFLSDRQSALPAERTEIRLADTHGYSRQPSNRPGYTNPWTVVTEGTFVTLPPDIKALREKRGFHAAFVLGAAAAIVSAAMKGLRVAAPPPSPAELIEDYLLSAAAEGA